MSRKRKLASAGFFVSGVLGVLMALNPAAVMAATTANVTLPFTYAFTVPGTLGEAGSLTDSWSPYWWVNSGGRMYLHDGMGSTIQGDLPATDYWAQAYKAADPGETDNGTHPQNIFRLVTRAEFQNDSQKVSYRINAYHLSADVHRSESNGLLLFNRYQNGMNTYYSGIRVDGHAVIKKKINGIYYTMAYPQIFPGAYNRDTNPFLLPKMGTWIKLKTEVVNLDANRVSIKLYMDLNKSGVWQLVASAIDDGHSFGGPAFTQPGHGGIRTDFMDVDLDNYEVKAL